jgi:hypothetical protein
MAEQQTLNLRVQGSSPCWLTNNLNVNRPLRWAVRLRLPQPRGFD